MADPQKISLSELLQPPRVEDQERTPTTPVGEDTFNPLAFAKPSWDEAVARFRDAGVTDVNPDDPKLFQAYQRAVDYFADMGMGGLELSDAAFKAVVGTAAELVPGQSDVQERRFERDVYPMPEAFMGASPASVQRATDTVVEGFSQVKRNLAAPSQAPESMNVLGSNFGNVRRQRPDLPIVQKFPEAEKVTLPDFQKVMGDLKDRYTKELKAAQERGAGASEGSYARRLSVLENADEKLVDDIINIYNDSEDPNEAARALFRKYDEFTIPSDVRVSDLQELSLNLNFEFSTSVPPGSIGTRFRSATEEVVQNLEVGKKGLLGARFLKQLRKNPDVRDTEWMSLDLQIDPKKLYTQEELVDIVSSNAYDVTVNQHNRYGEWQRQTKVGFPSEEKDYFELTVDATPRQGATPFKASDQHYYDETLAHTRASIQGPFGGSNSDSILVEELQSDLIQKGFETARKGETADIEANLKSADEKFASELEKVRGEGYRDFVWNDETGEIDIVDLSPDDNPQVKILDRWNALTDGQKKDLVYNASYADEDVRRRETRYAVEQYFSPATMDTYDISNITETILNSVKPSKTAVRNPPIAKTSESVSLAIDALMAEGQKRGVTTIVIPPLEKIVEARFPKGTQEYQDAMSKKSGFYQTYVDGVNKKIKELQQLGGVKVTKIEMPYEESRRGPVVETLTSLEDRDLDRVFNEVYGTEYASGDLGPLSRLIRTEPSEIIMNSDLEEMYRVALKKLNLLPTEGPSKLQGTKIDFTELAEERNLARPKFAEGGVVSTEKQMRRLFEEGGLGDDGTRMDPVSGNEVPPGSLAKEVRDDIPAQLSEGEYVIPADVVRYYGVKFFEDLRSQAKQGLMDMEQSGRIGGEPVDMTPGDEPLSPQEEMMLREMMGMAEGGMVPTMYNPVEQQQMLYQKPKGFQEGGLATPPAFDPSQFATPGASVFRTPSAAPTAPTTPQGQVLYVPYVNSAGNILMVPMYDTDGDGVGDTVQDGFVIPQGYQPQVATPQQAQQEPLGGESEPEIGEQPTVDTFLGVDTEQAWSEQQQQAFLDDPTKATRDLLSPQGAFGGMGKIGETAVKTGLALAGPGAMPIAVGVGVANKVNQVNNVAQAKAQLEIMKSQGLGTPEAIKALEAEINSAVKGDFALGALDFFGVLDNMSSSRVSAYNAGQRNATVPAVSETGLKTVQAAIERMDERDYALSRDLSRQGIGMSGINDVALGKIAGVGGTAGVVADPNTGKVVRTADRKTVFRAEDGTFYTKDILNRPQTIDFDPRGTSAETSTQKQTTSPSRTTPSVSSSSSSSSDGNDSGSDMWGGSDPFGGVSASEPSPSSYQSSGFDQAPSSPSSNSSPSSSPAVDWGGGWSDETGFLNKGGFVQRKKTPVKKESTPRGKRGLGSK